MHRLIWLTVVFCVIEPALGGPGDLDVRFGTHGQIQVPGQRDSAALVALPDGGILVFGKPEGQAARTQGALAITRLLANGRPDPTFGSGGHLDLHLGGEPHPVPTDALLLDDGRILVAGYFAGETDPWPYAFADRQRSQAAGWIVRLNQDAVRDTAFGVGGVARAGRAGFDRITMLTDGAIAAAAPGMLHRLESNGAPAFFPGSEVSAVAFGTGYYTVVAIAPLQDRSVIASAHFSGPMDGLELSRVSASGDSRAVQWRSLTQAFGEVGAFAADRDDSQVVVCGSGSESLLVVRGRPDETFDSAFAPATDNKVQLAVETRPDFRGHSWREPHCRSILPDSAGDYVIVGDQSRAREYGGGRVLLARLDSSGAIDVDFDRSGRGREIAVGMPDEWSSWYVADATTASDGAVLFIARRTTAPPPNDYYVRNELGEQRTLIARAEVAVTSSSGSIGFNDAALRIAERQLGELRVYRSGGSGGSVYIRYELLHDTTDELDIGSISGTLTWPDGDATPRTIALAPVNDATLEGEERFRVRLSAPAGGVGLGAPDIEVTIEDDEALRAVQFADSAMQIVEANTALVTITPPTTNGPIVLRYAVAADLDPTDGSPRPAFESRLHREHLVGQLKWSAGDTSSRTVRVQTLGSSNQQPNETLYVALADVAGTLRDGNDWKVARITVVDDPALTPPPASPTSVPSQPASSDSGGGGAISIAALLLLALTKLASVFRLCAAFRRRVRAGAADAPSPVRPAT